MSLNRAFINAYAKGSASPASASADEAPIAQARADCGATEEAHIAALPASRRRPHPIRHGQIGEVIRHMHPAEATSPAAPHLRIVATTEATTEATPTVWSIDRGAATSQRQGGPHFALPEAEAAPVGSQASRQPKSVAEAPTIRPAWQVEHVLWPAVVEQITSRVSAALDGLCAELSWHVRAGQRVVAVSSCHDGEGRTSLALVLGRRLAGYGLRVALIDGYLAAPVLAQRLGLAPVHGWQDLLEGTQPLEETLVESAVDRLVVLPGTSPLDHEPAAAEPIVARAVAELRDTCDLVLIDTPPLSGSGAPSPKSVTMFHPDAAILVHDQRATTVAQLQTAVRALRGAGVSTWGVVENFLRG